jgi:glyoxylate/hydroxypyruvate reductase A
MALLLLAADFMPDERERWRAALAEALPDEAWVESGDAFDRADVEIAVVANPAPGSLQGLPSLRLIQSLWAGVDRLLLDPTLPADVPLARLVDPAMNEAMAETALWAVLSLHRGFFDYAKQQHELAWVQQLQRRADEVSVLVLGLGQMGGTVAKRLAFNGYRVTGWNRHAATVNLPGVVCRHGEDELDELLPKAEIVVNLLPLTPATRGLLNAQTFGAMRRGASLVNLARGAHVVEADLLAALHSGRLRHAVLDVFAQEPLPAEHAFWRHPQVTVLPHVAALTDPRSAARIAAANVQALRDGRPLQNLVERGRGY